MGNTTRSPLGGLCAALLAAVAGLGAPLPVAAEGTPPARAGAPAEDASPAALRVPAIPQPRLIGVADGLPSSAVNGIAADSVGHVWVATADGLARHDGRGFRVWRHDPADPGSLPGNYITAVHVDGRDQVWVAVEGRGLAVLDRQRRRFRHHADATNVWALASDADALWYGSFDGGVSRLGHGETSAGGHWSGEESGLPADTILALRFDAGGTLWAGTTEGLARRSGERFETVALPGGDPQPIIYSITPEGRALWIGARSGIFRVEPDGRVTAPRWSGRFGAGNAAFAVEPDGDGGHWIATQQGLWNVPAEGDPVPAPIGNKGPTRALQQMLRQDDGALWMPVPGVGLGYLRPDWRRMAVLSSEEGGLSGQLYRDVVPARDGGLWLLARGGQLERLGPDGRVRPVRPDLWERLEQLRPLTMVEDPVGRLWIGGSGPGALARVEPDGDGFEAWTPESPYDPTMLGQVDHLLVAPDGTLWLANAGSGLQQRDPGTGRVLRSVRGGPGLELPDGALESLVSGPSGGLWASGSFGVAMLPAGGGAFAPVPGLPTGDRVFALAFASPGELWLQRLSGLEQYRLADGRWQRDAAAGSEEGLPAVEGSGLAVDPRGRAWLASTRGLHRWDPQAGRLRSFGLSDGLSSQEFLDQGMVLGDSGVLAAALADGSVMLLDTMVADPPPREPALVVDALAVRRDGAWHPLAGDEPRLSPDDREVRLRLALLAFANPAGSRFETWLVGHDSGWIEQGGNPERVWAGLAPGRHVIRARAVDADGNASVEQRIRFELPPPWWRSGAALAAWTGLATLLAWGGGRAVRRRVAHRRRLRNAERERALALEASEAKSRFLANLGHEVRTPMTGVLGMTELLLGDPLGSQQRARAESIRTAGEHLLRLLDDALDLARIEAGRLELEHAPFDPRELVAQVAQLTAPLARRRGLDFDCTVAAAVPVAVLGDATRVRQILLNLLGNAVKFTARGSVRLEVDVDDAGTLRFAVEDTGPGLQAEQVERLFQRFEQADGARTAARHGGSGLGLAISRELAGAMGGGIGIDTRPGVGSRFTVVLPLAAAPAPVRAQAGAAASTPRGGHALLLVEDDPVVAEVIAGLLRARGHEVKVAGHGLAALAEAAVLPLDAALLDLDLPGMDGLALARQLRAQGVAIPLLAITARADPDVEEEVAAAGFAGFLRKPVTGERLATALAAALDRAAAAPEPELSAR